MNRHRVERSGRLKRSVQCQLGTLVHSLVAMLNLSFIFDDANAAMAEYADRLAVVPLPAAVYMMQVDVLNSYTYALTYYFTRKLW